MKQKAVIKTTFSEIYKIRHSIRSRLEVQIHYNFTFVRRYFGKNLSSSRVILVKNFPLSKSICGKAYERSADNKLFKQI